MLWLSTFSKMSFKEEAVKYLSRTSRISGKSKSICFTVNTVSHFVHIGWSSPARVANFQPVYDYRIPAGNEIIVDAFANSWIDCMKLVVCSTAPHILPFFKAEPGSTRFKVRILLDSQHVKMPGNERADTAAKAALCLPVTSMKLPASDYFASFYEACVVFDNFKHQIQFKSKGIEGFQAWLLLWIREDDKSTVFAMTNKIDGKRNCVQCNCSEDTGFIW